MCVPVCVRPFMCEVAGVVNTCLCASECLEWVCVYLFVFVCACVQL